MEWLTVTLTCPGCGERSDASVGIHARLERTETDHGIGSLRVRVKSTPIAHRCGQIRLPDPDPDDDGTRPLDFAELAAGEGARLDPSTGITSR